MEDRAKRAHAILCDTNPVVADEIYDTILALKKRDFTWLDRNDYPRSCFNAHCLYKVGDYFVTFVCQETNLVIFAILTESELPEWASIAINYPAPDRCQG